MRPEFGCRIHDHVFAPINAATAGAIAYDVRDALERWEPRIDVDDVLVSFDRADAGTLYIDIRYSIRGTTTRATWSSRSTSSRRSRTRPRSPPRRRSRSNSPSPNGDG